MRNFFIRLIAVVLIPTLVLEPSLASPWSIQGHSRNKTTACDPQVWNEQALIAAFVSSRFLGDDGNYNSTMTAAVLRHQRILWVLGTGAGLWTLHRVKKWVKGWPRIRRRYELNHFYRHQALEVLQDYSGRVDVAWKLYELVNDSEVVEKSSRPDFSPELAKALLDARNFHINYPQSTFLQLEEQFNYLKIAYPKLPQDEFPILRLGLGLDWPAGDDASGRGGTRMAWLRKSAAGLVSKGVQWGVQPIFRIVRQAWDFLTGGPKLAHIRKEFEPGIYKALAVAIVIAVTRFYLANQTEAFLDAGGKQSLILTAVDLGAIFGLPWLTTWNDIRLLRIAEAFNEKAREYMERYVLYFLPIHETPEKVGYDIASRAGDLHITYIEPLVRVISGVTSICLGLQALYAFNSAWFGIMTLATIFVAQRFGVWLNQKEHLSGKVEDVISGQDSYGQQIHDRFMKAHIRGNALEGIVEQNSMRNFSELRDLEIRSGTATHKTEMWMEYSSEFFVAAMTTILGVTLMPYVASISVDGIVALSLYMTNLASGIVVLTEFYSRYKGARGIVHEIIQPLPVPPLTEDKMRRTNAQIREGRIQADHVSLTIGEKELFRDLSYEFQPGHFYEIVGDVDVGKSTLINLLSGSEFPTQGRIEIDGYDVSEYEFGEQIGVATQNALLLPGESLYGNFLRMKPDATPEVIREALAAVNFELKDIQGRSLRKSSQGLLKRLAIAGVVLRNPKIAFFDQPMRDLNFRTKPAIKKAILTMWRNGATTFVVTQEDHEIWNDIPHTKIEIRDGEVIFTEHIPLSGPDEPPHDTGSNPAEKQALSTSA